MNRPEYIDGHRWPKRATSPVAPGPSGEVPADRRDLPAADASRPAVTPPAGSALPDALRDFLALPDVIVRPDEERCAVVIAMPSYLARSLAALAPDPLQVRLAAQLVEAAEMDAADARLDLLRDEAS